MTGVVFYLANSIKPKHITLKTLQKLPLSDFKPKVRLYSEPLQFHSKKYLDPLKSRQLGRICWIVLFKRPFFFMITNRGDLPQPRWFILLLWVNPSKITKIPLTKMTFMSTTQIKKPNGIGYLKHGICPNYEGFDPWVNSKSHYDRYVVQLWCSNLPYINFFLCGLPVLKLDF